MLTLADFEARYGVGRYWGVKLNTGNLTFPINGRRFGLPVAVQGMPVYCNNCKSTLPDIYCHLGSRYGQVGTINCGICKADIHVRDNDFNVDEIWYNGEYVDFYELYKFRNEYTAGLERAIVDTSLICVLNFCLTK